MLSRASLILILLAMLSTSCNSRKYGHRTVFRFAERSGDVVGSADKTPLIRNFQSSLRTAPDRVIMAEPVEQNVTELTAIASVDHPDLKNEHLISVEHVIEKRDKPDHRRSAVALNGSKKVISRIVRPQNALAPSGDGTALLLLGVPTLVCLLLAWFTNITALGLILIWAMLILFGVMIFLSDEFE